MAPDSSNHSELDIELATRERYAKASNSVEKGLCCAITTYPRELMDNIPGKIREVDYGCGDPTKWAEEGDIVVDLGSGSGKACYIMAQRVGGKGHVIGVDFNPPMLDLSRSGLKEFESKTGLTNVEFRKGRIQDLALDLEQVEGWLAEHPVTCSDELVNLEAEMAHLRAKSPLIKSETVSLIVSNCVLNLARDEEKTALFHEMHRILKRGGRCVISDIVSDEAVPAHLKSDPDLWSGCISGAMQEMEFLRAFEEAGFHGIEILSRDSEPWQTVEGIEFRSVTVRAYKGKVGPCIEKNQAVIYKGPWKSVQDDDGHTFIRGERMAVCEKTFNIMAGTPYRDHMVAVEPRAEVTGEPKAFDCSRDSIRHPRETKGMHYRETKESSPSSCCEPNSTCC